jgi:hypothetical protein
VVTARSGARPAPTAVGGGLAVWVRQRRTRSHLAYLPKWTARRPEPFGIGGLHWLPAPTGPRDPALLLRTDAGGRGATLIAAAEMSPNVLRRADSGDLGARIGAVLRVADPERFPPTRVQLLHQVPGPAGRTRSYAIVSVAYNPALVSDAARFAQGERGLTAVACRAVEDAFGALGADRPEGARLGPLVPLDRAGLTALFGSLVLPGRGRLSAASESGIAWQPTEIDARAPRAIAVTGPIGPGGRGSTWWHATGWVKRWPRSVGGLDLAACAGFLPPGVSGAASMVVGLVGPPGDRGPAAAGYLTVSGHDGGEVEAARVAVHAAADRRAGHIEFCDRRHHVAFAHTLPLATGLAG